MAIGLVNGCGSQGYRSGTHVSTCIYELTWPKGLFTHWKLVSNKDGSISQVSKATIIHVASFYFGVVTNNLKKF